MTTSDLYSKLKPLPPLRGIYALVAISIFAFAGLAMPLALTSLEDNVDGLAGYFGFFAGVSGVAAAAYGLGAYVVFRVGNQFLRQWLIRIGLAVMLSILLFAFVQQPDAGVLDNFIFAQPAALRATTTAYLLDCAVLILSIIGSTILLRLPQAWLTNILSIFILGCVGITGASVYSLADRMYRKSESDQATAQKLFSFSRTSQNVVVLFLDGAMTGYVPQILEAEPRLATELDGFDWYSNVVSTGNRTINGLPALFGGFDYTVSEINRRPGKLIEKVSNAYKLYPDNFSEKGFDVLYSDPFWFGLARKGDCELFNQLYEQLGKAHCIHSIGKGIGSKREALLGDDRSDYFSGLAKQYAAITLFRIAPRTLKESIYADGRWLGMSYVWKKKEDKYLNNFLSLTGLGEMSDVSSTKPTFKFITNEITRAPLFVGTDCIPDRRLTASLPTIAPLVKANVDADTAAIFQTTHCALRGLAGFIGWLKREGIYDNTMVVVASDHGWLSHNPLLRDVSEPVRYSMFQAFLMTKDFNAHHPLAETHEFIANANVPGLVCESIGGCVDRHTGNTIRRVPLVGSVLLHETPWQPSGQREDGYVIEGLHSVRSDISKSGNWRDLPLSSTGVTQLSSIDDEAD